MAIRIVAALAVAVAGCAAAQPTGTPWSCTADAGEQAQTDHEPYDVELAQRQRCAFHAGDSVATTIAPSGLPDASKVQHVVVLLRENRSFDHYLGCYAQSRPGEIDGPAQDASNDDPTTHTRIPRYHETRYCVKNSHHEWSDVHLQLDHGNLDGFVSTSNDDPGYVGGGRAMGYYDKQDLPFYYWLADTFAISDRYFASLPGPTHPNISFYFHATACGFLEGVQDSLDPNRNISLDCGLSAPSIFDLLDKASPRVTSQVYSYNSSLTSGFAASKVLGGYRGEVHSIDQFKLDAAQGQLANVVFVESTYNPIESPIGGVGENDEHPPYDVQLGQQFSFQVVDALLRSPLWGSTVLFISWDEHGGYFDHRVPPAACPPDDADAELDFKLDQYGFRVPLLVVSPFARPRYVSHYTTDHTSITRFIEYRWNLGALTARDANAWPLLDLFDFAGAPLATAPTAADPGRQTDSFDSCSLVGLTTGNALSGVPPNAAMGCRP
jgi:phospholipase C